MTLIEERRVCTSAIVSINAGHERLLPMVGPIKFASEPHAFSILYSSQTKSH